MSRRLLVLVVCLLSGCDNLGQSKFDTAYQRGVEAYNRRDYDTAITALGEAIGEDSEFEMAYYYRALAWKEKGKTSAAISDFNRVLMLSPENFEVYGYRALLWGLRKEYAKALADYEEVYGLEPDNSHVCNQLAWFLATCPADDVRDGPRAVEIATRGCQLSGWDDAPVLDTLAAAHAEAGQFDEAVMWQTKAASLTRFGHEGFQARLALYQAKKPYREEPSEYNRPPE